LRQLLLARRRELVATLHDRIRFVRAERTATVTQGGLDEEEASEVDFQEGIELALIEMQAEALAKIKQALARLDAGSYGVCESCGAEIASARLRALPFAVRCRDCEVRRETERAQARATRSRENAAAALSRATF
jgi:DnaK suppressor protein